MNAEKLRIQARHRGRVAVITSLADFEISPAGAIDAEQLLDDSRFSLYCLDEARQRAIFTALPPGLDLARAPFMYQAQFDSAEYLAALPFASFTRLAKRIPLDETKVIFLHNIARCGSTVLSRAFNAAEGLLSLSEPDALTNCVRLEGLPLSAQYDLMRACIAWLCRPAVIDQKAHVAIKFRNQATSIMKGFVDALPAATHFFLYRNVIDWLASFHRLRSKRNDPVQRFTRAQAIARQAAYMQCPPAALEAFAHPDFAIYTGLEERALSWLYMLDQYLRLKRAGAPVAAIRYEDLQQNRDAVLERILDLSRLPRAALPSMLRAFESDAQAGTAFARDDDRGNTLALPASQQATVRKLLSRQEVINRADFVLPGTLSAD